MTIWWQGCSLSRGTRSQILERFLTSTLLPFALIFSSPPPHPHPLISPLFYQLSLDSYFFVQTYLFVYAYSLMLCCALPSLCCLVPMRVPLFGFDLFALFLGQWVMHNGIVCFLFICINIVSCITNYVYFSVIWLFIFVYFIDIFLYYYLCVWKTWWNPSGYLPRRNTIGFYLHDLKTWWNPLDIYRGDWK